MTLSQNIINYSPIIIIKLLSLLIGVTIETVYLKRLFDLDEFEDSVLHLLNGLEFS